MNSVNKRNNSYQQSAMFKFIQMLADGIDAIGEGMSKELDEDLLEKKKPSKNIR